MDLTFVKNTKTHAILSDPYWVDNLHCVLWDKKDGRKKHRYQFDNLIKYGPLDPQTFFIQAWHHSSIWHHTMELFGEVWTDRFLRLAADSHVGALTFSHTGNGDPLAVVNNATFYDHLFDLQQHPVFQPCPGTWESWGEWSNCDRSCNDGLRVRNCFESLYAHGIFYKSYSSYIVPKSFRQTFSRERECSAGTAALCDGSERDMQACNDQPCYDWPNKDWADWTTWGQCSQSCNGGTRERRRFCKNLDNSCGDESELDYEVIACNEESCPINSCGKELKINLDQTKFHTENFFRYDGLYHRSEDNPVDQDCVPNWEKGPTWLSDL